MDQPPMAGDVLMQHATNAMLQHATDVAALRNQIAIQRAALEAAYSAMDAMEASAPAVPSVPGYAEWRAAKKESAR